MSREIMQQVLSSLMSLQPTIANGLLDKRQLAFIDPHLDMACEALIAELAKPEQEPVGEVLDERGKVDWISFVPPTGTLLYTVPPQRQPLTDEEIDKLMTDAARYRKLVAMEAALVEPVMIWHYLRNPDDLDTAHDIKEQA